MSNKAVVLFAYVALACGSSNAAESITFRLTNDSWDNVLVEVRVGMGDCERSQTVHEESLVENESVTIPLGDNSSVCWRRLNDPMDPNSGWAPWSATTCLTQTNCSGKV
jgi:hypothetical protein